MNRYIVFERTMGSKCWTLVHVLFNGRYFPATFAKRKSATIVAKEIKKKMGWWGGMPNQRPMQVYVATIKLPK